VDSDLTDSDLAETRLLCVGALTPTKGQDLLVAALAGVRDLPWTATLVGPLRDPGHVDAVRAAIERHGLAGRVELTGPLTGAALGAAYAGTDLLVVPSRAETYGMVVTEALARGIPVLVSDAGGLPETLGRDRRAACRGWSSRPVALRTSAPRCTVGWRPGPAGRGSVARLGGVGACCTDGR
jgi:glycosyltransferase involved in cell wall biosynthesis